MGLFPTAEDPQLAQEEIDHQNKAGGQQLGGHPRKAPAGEQVEQAGAQSEHQPAQGQKPDHLGAKELLLGAEGPAAVDHVAVEHPRRIAAHLGEIDVHPQIGIEHPKKDQIHQGVSHAGEGKLQKLFQIVPLEEGLDLFHAGIASPSPFPCPKAEGERAFFL